MLDQETRYVELREGEKEIEEWIKKIILFE